MHPRFKYLLFFLLTIALGLGSRMSFFRDLIGTWPGDLLYAVMMYWLWSILFPHQAKAKTALFALSTCFAIELLQLYQAEWILVIRATRLGALILGSGFLISDLLWYSLGVLLAYSINRGATRPNSEAR